MLERSTKIRIGLAFAGLVCVSVAAFLLTDGFFNFRTDDYLKGQAVYFDHCAVCHAPDGSGVEFQGVALAGSTFMKGLTDEELKIFIMVGRPADSPDSIMEETMLGVDYLEDTEYEVLIRFLRRLNTQ